ncbi:MAG: DUF4255 domain-containing protein [Chloroflexi bacterium]|nr:DUF4255 domain-containing protein [Chloroflexota bacterium]
MSNYLAVATTTVALKRTLQDAIDVDVPGATVTANRPDANTNGSTGVNIFLYSVTPNPHLRNMDLPTRSAGGRILQRPQAAINLHYLLTFYGDDTQMEPQRLLGSVVRTLHSTPVLARSVIREAIADPSFPFLARSDLDQEVEIVKFSPSLISLEELSRLWSMFSQTPYALSAAYEASVILIESQDTPQPTKPVRQPGLYVVPFQQPVIERVFAVDDDEDENSPHEPVIIGRTLVVEGQRLRNADPNETMIRLAGVDIPLDPAHIRPSRISVLLDAPALDVAMLRAGVQGTQIVHPMEMGDPPIPHRWQESNVGAFVLHPTITLPATDIAGVDVDGDGLLAAEITVDFEPPVGKGQRVALLLDEFNAPGNRAPHTYAFPAPYRNTPAAPDSTSSITFDAEHVVPGTYLLRVRVSGAESLMVYDDDPESDTYNQFIEPRVTIT